MPRSRNGRSRGGRLSRCRRPCARPRGHHVAPGVSEAELAGLAAAAMHRDAGRRVPAILTVSAGAEASATGGGVATDRVVRSGDLVLTDTSPWIDGAWSDSANAVFVGTPDRETVRRFDAVR